MSGLDNLQRIEVEKACASLVAAGKQVTFTEVAKLAGVSRATLYRRPELRALVEEHQRRSNEAYTLTGLATQVAQLRMALEALAAKVRRHEEALRHLTPKRIRR